MLKSALALSAALAVFVSSVVTAEDKVQSFSSTNKAPLVFESDDGILRKVSDLTGSETLHKSSFVKNKNIFVYYLEKDKNKISDLYRAFNLGKVPEVKDGFPFFLISQFNLGSEFFSSLFYNFGNNIIFQCVFSLITF